MGSKEHLEGLIASAERAFKSLETQISQAEGAYEESETILRTGVLDGTPISPAQRRTIKRGLSRKQRDLAKLKKRLKEGHDLVAQLKVDLGNLRS